MKMMRLAFCYMQRNTYSLMNNHDHSAIGDITAGTNEIDAEIVTSAYSISLRLKDKADERNIRSVKS